MMKMRCLFGGLLLFCLGLNLAFSQADRKTEPRTKTSDSQAIAANRLVKVDIRDIESLAIGREIAAELQKLTFVSKAPIVGDDWHLRFQRSTDGSSMLLERKGYKVFEKIAFVEKGRVVATVIEAVEREGRWKAIKLLKNTDPNSRIKIELRIVPVRVENAQNRTIADVTDAKKLREIRQNELDKGDYFTFEVKNMGSVDAYIAIISSAPNGYVQALFPIDSGTDSRIAADGKWHRSHSSLRAYAFDLPPGEITFKAIAAENRIDAKLFESILPTHANLNEKADPMANWATAEAIYQVGRPRTLHVLSIATATIVYEGLANVRRKIAGRWLLGSTSTAFSRGFREFGRNMFDRVSVTQLEGKRATRTAIIDALERIAIEARPQDCFVFHFAGEAKVPSSGKKKEPLSLLPSDWNYESPTKNLISGDLLRVFFSKIQAGQLFALIDAEQSTGFGDFASKFENDYKELEGLLQRDTWVIGVDDVATDRFRINAPGSLFPALTTSLLIGMTGDADINSDGNISVGELIGYSENYMKKGPGNSFRSNLVTTHWKSGTDFHLLKTAPGIGDKVNFRSPATNSRIAILTDLPPYRFHDVSFQFPIPTSTPPNEEPKTRSEIIKVGKSQQSKYERKGKDYALLVGVDEYDNWGKLNNPIKDVETVAEELRTYYGFEIDSRTDILRNPKKKDVFDALRRIKARQYQPDDQLFIFFAGHGHYSEARKEGYLIFADAPGLDSSDELCLNCDSYLSHSMLRNVLNGFGSKHIFVVIDACFAGTFDESIKRRGSDPLYEDATNLEMIKRIMEFKTRRFLTSGGKEYVPDGRAGQHSPFARRFLDALRSYGGNYGMLTINGILSHVERVTPMPRKGEWGDNESGSDFVFVSSRKTP